MHLFVCSRPTALIFCGCIFKPKKKKKTKNVFKTSAKPSYFFVTEPSISSAHYQIEFLDDSVAIKMVKTKFLAS